MSNNLNFDQVVKFTQELVQTESLSGQEGEAARLVQGWMEDLGFDSVQVDENGNVAGSIIGQKPGAGRRVLFDAHMDTVPPVQPDRWTRDPFAGEISDGRLYGLGSVDMKGSLVAMVTAAAEMPKDEFAGTIFVSASVGEEAVEGLALSSVLELTQPDYVVIGEPTSFRLGIAQRGRTTIVIESKGKAAHSSDPKLGKNAVYTMAEVIRRLQKMDLPTDEILGVGVMELIDIISDPYPSASTIPHLCMARYDRRLVRGETPQSVLADTNKLLADLEGVDVAIRIATFKTYAGSELEALDFHPAWAAGDESRLAVQAKRALQSHSLDPDPVVVHFCSNGSTTAGEAGIPTIILGPPSIERAHSVDEYIETQDLFLIYSVYKTLGLLLLQG
jgi:putative selenium metabolism hydrolase